MANVKSLQGMISPQKSFLLIFHAVSMGNKLCKRSTERDVSALPKYDKLRLPTRQGGLVATTLVTQSSVQQLHRAVLGTPLQVYRQLILITVYGFMN